MRLAVCACVLALTGCIPVTEDGACYDESDCSGGEVCTDIKECADPDDAPPWRIAWTVNGTPVSSAAPGDCEGVEELTLTIRSNMDQVSYAPVPCAVGSFEFLSLPLRFNGASLRATGPGGERLGSTSGGNDRSSDLVLDLEL